MQNRIKNKTRLREQRDFSKYPKEKKAEKVEKNLSKWIGSLYREHSVLSLQARLAYNNNQKWIYLWKLKAKSIYFEWTELTKFKLTSHHELEFTGVAAFGAGNYPGICTASWKSDAPAVETGDWWVYRLDFDRGDNILIWQSKPLR